MALARFCRRLDPLHEPRQKLLVHRVADAVGLRKLPPVFLSHRAGVPVSIGLLRPAIVLPAAMPREPDDGQLQAVLLHEAAHIARHDHWMGVGQRLAAVLFWWNPLVHWLCDEISEVREEICDNHVVLIQGEGRPLARILVHLAARVTTGPRLPSTVGVLEPERAGLTGRVSRLLNEKRNIETRMSLGSKVLVLACSLAALIGTATVGGMRLAHTQPAAMGKACHRGRDRRGRWLEGHPGWNVEGRPHRGAGQARQRSFVQPAYMGGQASPVRFSHRLAGGVRSQV